MLAMLLSGPPIMITNYSYTALMVFKMGYSWALTCMQYAHSMVELYLQQKLRMHKLPDEIAMVRWAVASPLAGNCILPQGVAPAPPARHR